MASPGPALRDPGRAADHPGMTTATPRTPGRHRASEPTEEPRWATAAEFLASWTRVGRHATPEPGRHAAGEDRPTDGDVFDWLGFTPAAS